MSEDELLAGLITRHSAVLLVGGDTQGERIDHLSDTGAGVCLIHSDAAVLAVDRPIEIHLGHPPTVAHELSTSRLFDLIVLDGPCRCMDCTIILWALLARHVRAGGSFAITQTNPVIEGEHQGHGSMHRAYRVAARHGLARLELLDGMHPRWKLTHDIFDPSRTDGGVIVFERRF